MHAGIAERGIEREWMGVVLLGFLNYGVGAVVKFLGFWKCCG